MSKSQELLNSLKNITETAPRPLQEAKVNSYTNRYYPNTIHILPTRYDNAKRLKDEDGEEYIMIDRVYGGLYTEELHQADGTRYRGKLYQKRRLVTSKDPFTKEKKKFYSRCTATADGRWFDNCGLPIEPPKEIENEQRTSEQNKQLDQDIRNPE